MSLSRFGRRIVRRYEDDIHRMVGGNLNGVNFGFGNDGTYTSGQDVTFDRQWWNSATRKDRKGALIHELTHVATRNQGLGGDTGSWSGNYIEKQADAVRLALNGKYGINPDTLAAARRIATQNGWLGGGGMTTSGNTGPTNGNDARRSRNTLVNNASKAGYTVSSAGAVGYGDQLAAARYQYLSQLAALKAQGGLIRSQKLQDIAAARAAAPGNIAAVEQYNTERGMLGSSVDVQGRAGAVAQMTGDIASAKAAAAAGRLGLKSGRLDAQGNYYQTVSGIQNAMAQEQMANGINAFGNDQYDALVQHYRDVIAQLRDQASGRTPRHRKGVPTPPVHDGTGNVQYGYTPYGKPLY